MADPEDDMWTDYAPSDRPMKVPGRYRGSDEEMQTDYLRRIHFWVRLWSVLLILGASLAGLIVAYALIEA